MHIYELLKFVLKSLSNIHSESFCNERFHPYIAEKETRQKAANFLKIPLCKRKIERYSIKFRCIKLYNKLKSLEIIPRDFKSLTAKEVSSFCHNLKGSNLECNQELARFFFEI